MVNVWLIYVEKQLPLWQTKFSYNFENIEILGLVLSDAEYQEH